MKSTVVNRVLGVAIVILLGVAAWFFFDVGKWLTVRQNLTDICDDRDTARARQNLLDLGDRAYVITSIKAALKESGDSIKCKKNYLQTLGQHYFNQPRVIDRALDSDEPNTRRAAAALKYGDTELRDQCAAIALEWLKDDDADSRHDAALIARQLKLKEAVPILLGFLDIEPETPDDLQLLQHALGALKEFKPEGLAQKLLAMVGNASLGTQVQGLALEALGRVDDAPRDEVRALAIRLLKDRTGDTLLRGKAASVLRRKEYAGEESWQAAESVLMDEAEKDTIVQRLCLSTLGETLPLDRAIKVLMDRRVYTNPYFGIRIDVATALGALDVREGVAYDLLCEYLVDEDPADTQFLVRQEAWLSLWMLTQFAYGVTEKDLFARAPKAIRDKKIAREYMWRAAFTRPGVSRPQVDALEPVVSNLATMKKIRQTYQGRKDAVRLRWDGERKAAEAIEKKKDEVGSVGPKPPEKEEEKKKE